MSRVRTSIRVAALVAITAPLLVILVLNGVRFYGDHALARARVQFASEFGSTDPAAYAPPSVTPERNGATWIQAGSAALVDPQDRIGGTWSGRPAADWTADERGEVRQLVSMNTDALAILDKARTLTESSLELDYTQARTDREIDALVGWIKAAKLIAARGDLARRDGDIERSIADVELLGTMVRAFERERMLIVTSVGFAVERLQLGLVHALIEDPRSTLADLEAIEAALGRADPNEEYLDALRIDSLVFLAQHSADGRRVRWFDFRIEPYLASLQIAWGFAETRRMIEIIDQPYASLARLDLFGLAGIQTLALPNLINGAGRAALCNSQRRATLLAIELRRNAARTGRYPESLDGLIDPTIPDPLTGGTIEFATTDDGTASITIPGATAIVASLYPPRVGEHSERWHLPALAAQRDPR